MQCRIADLRCKEVINICNGYRLGFVDDVLLDVTDGRIIAIVVPGPCRVLGMFGHEDDYIIGWEHIKRIGDDIILIEVAGEQKRAKRPHKFWF